MDVVFIVARRLPPIDVREHVGPKSSGDTTRSTFRSSEESRNRWQKIRFSIQSTRVRTDVCDAALPGFLIEEGDGRSEWIHLG